MSNRSSLGVKHDSGRRHVIVSVSEGWKSGGPDSAGTDFGVLIGVHLGMM